MTNIIEIIDYLYEGTNKSKLSVTFKPHDGYIALPSIMDMCHPSNNPLFGAIIGSSIGARINGKLNIHQGSRNLRYRKTRLWSGSCIPIYSGYFSVIASSDDFDYMPSSIFQRPEHIEYRMKGMVDMFCLGIVKITDLPNVIKQKPSRYVRRRKDNMTITTKINLPSIKIIVSTEKLRKTAYTNDNYTKTFRREIISELERIKRIFGMPVEDVPDDYIQGFFEQPDAYKTRSITEAMRIDKEIKDRVFLNLNKKVV